MKKYKLKKSDIICFLLIVPLLIIACFSYNISDYNQYMVSYNRIANNIFAGYQMEFGYIFLEKIGVALNLNFEIFRAIYLLFALVLLTFSFATYVGKYKWNILILYFVYPFILDVVQMRHLMACAITIYAIRFLMEKSKKNAIKYCIGIFLAASQHLVAFLYIILLLVYVNIDIKKFAKYVIIILCGEIAFIQGLGVIGFSNTIFNMLQIFFLSFRGAGHIALERTNAVNKYYILMICILALLIYMLFERSKISYRSITEETDGVYDCLYRIALLSLCYIPLVGINDQFARAHRGLMIVTYIVFLIYAKRKPVTSIKSITYRLFPITIAILSFFMMLSPRSLDHWENITKPMFKYNYFVEWVHGK